MEENAIDEPESKTVEEEEFETNIAGSEEVELSISLILEKIENYTQRVAIYSYIYRVWSLESYCITKSTNSMACWMMDCL